MGILDRKSSNRTTVNERNVNTADNRVGGDNSVFGGNLTFGDGTVGAVVSVTDHGAVSRSFDSFDKVVSTSERQSNRALDAIVSNTDKTTAALKEFATQLTVGDIESAKWISFAIIAAVMIALIVYFVWGQ